MASETRPSQHPAGLAGWRQAWLPAAAQPGLRERLRALAGAAVGLLCAGVLARWMGGAAGPWLIAPMGASAVLVFCVPASPMAQPWAVVGGNTVSALVGVACALLLHDPAWAGALAVALAIGLMFQLRCLHPPGGATALFMVLGQVGDFHFAAFPVLADSLLMVAAGIAFNNLTGRAYPHRQGVPPEAPPGAGLRITKADLDAALSQYNQVLDVSRDDLDALLHHAEAAAYQRTLGELRCEDVMTRAPVSVTFGTPLADAWALMREHGVKALPVTDRVMRIAGILTAADFLRHAGVERHDGIGQRLRSFVRPSGASHGERAEVVGQIMTRQVQVISAERHLTDLVPLFSRVGHHHIPVIDADRKLVGMISQSDVIAALARALVRP